MPTENMFQKKTKPVLPMEKDYDHSQVFLDALSTWLTLLHRTGTFPVTFDSKTRIIRYLYSKKFQFQIIWEFFTQLFRWNWYSMFVFLLAPLSYSGMLVTNWIYTQRTGASFSNMSSMIEATGFSTLDLNILFSSSMLPLLSNIVALVLLRKNYK